MTEVNLVISEHAKEQAQERGISINEIKETISKGAKIMQGGKNAGKIVAEYRHVKVMFKKQRDEYFVITVMIR